MSFQSNQSGIETSMLHAVKININDFQSNQSGIETGFGHRFKTHVDTSNRTKVELKQTILSIL